MSQRKRSISTWHSLGLADVGMRLDASEHGIGEDEADARLSELGLSALPLATHAASWRIALRQFRGPLNYILGVAAVILVAIGDIDRREVANALDPI